MLTSCTTECPGFHAILGALASPHPAITELIACKFTIATPQIRGQNNSSHIQDQCAERFAEFIRKTRVKTINCIEALRLLYAATQGRCAGTQDAITSLFFFFRAQSYPECGGDISLEDLHSELPFQFSCLPDPAHHARRFSDLFSLHHPSKSFIFASKLAVFIDQAGPPHTNAGPLVRPLLLWQEF